jgi:hypothetical protein
MPLCTNCGSHDVDHIDENEYACLDCDQTFFYDGVDEDNELVVFPDGDSDDMMMFDDRISCLGDEE